MSPISSVVRILHPCCIAHERKDLGRDYTDQCKLIQPYPDTDKTDQHKFANLDGQSVMTPKTNQKKIISLEAWTDAFIVLLWRMSFDNR